MTPYFAFLSTGIPRPSSHYSDAFVGMNIDPHVFSVSCKRFVYTVIDDFIETVMDTGKEIGSMYMAGRLRTGSSPSGRRSGHLCMWILLSY